jgi:hypothetical protein
MARFHLCLREDQVMLCVSGPASNIGCYLWSSRRSCRGFGWLMRLGQGQGVEMVHRSSYAAVMAGFPGLSVLQACAAAICATSGDSGWHMLCRPQLTEVRGFARRHHLSCRSYAIYVGRTHTVCASECTVARGQRDLV